MNHDLIEKLKALNPTKGAWIIDEKFDLRINCRRVAITTGTSDEDDTLITPTPDEALSDFKAGKINEEQFKRVYKA